MATGKATARGKPSAWGHRALCSGLGLPLLPPLPNLSPCPEASPTSLPLGRRPARPRAPPPGSWPCPAVPGRREGHVRLGPVGHLGPDKPGLGARAHSCFLSMWGGGSQKHPEGLAGGPQESPAFPAWREEPGETGERNMSTTTTMLARPLPPGIPTQPRCPEPGASRAPGPAGAHVQQARRRPACPGLRQGPCSGWSRSP